MVCPTTQALWEMTQRTMAPVVLLKSRRTQAEWEGISAQVSRSLVAKLGSGEQRVTLTALLTTATKPLVRASG
ncbi:MAG: hypothetical protein RJA70_592 [Pseudomonadota bacterium]|jgi:hypothetical protein